MHRRDFARLAGVAAVAPRTVLRTHAERANESARPTAMWPGYERAIAIDCLASPGPFNTPDAIANPLTPEMILGMRKYPSPLRGVSRTNLRYTLAL